ncbi:MAG: hypothetical protein Q7S27_04670 [Nanoarchaeota archaeon]|nr:hypothetical protein [Nanoarchaeota archaeon]
MLVKKPVIEKDLRKTLNSNIDYKFRYKEGDNLESAIKEVLADRDIFTFFALFFKPRQGLKLGSMGYLDDSVRVEQHYGLMLDFENLPRRLKLFMYETTSPSYPNREIEVNYVWDLNNGERQLNVETFIEQVNETLRYPRKYLVELNEGFRIESS